MRPSNTRPHVSGTRVSGEDPGRGAAPVAPPGQQPDIAALRDGLAPAGHFRGADLRHIDLQEAKLRGVMLGGAQLDESVLEAAHLQGADLSAVSMRGAKANGADLSEALLEDADLTEASLRFATLDGAILETGILVRTDLWGASLRGAGLQHADLEQANLEEADLSHADLTGANLRGAVLRRAVLTGASLRGADLRGAVVDRTDFKDADFAEARLDGLVLLNSNIDGIGLANAQLDRTVIDPAALSVTREERARDWRAAARAWHSLERNYLSLGEPEESSRAYRRRRRMQKLAARSEAREALGRGDIGGTLRTGARAIADELVEWVCDYGESIPRVIGSIVVLALMFAGIYAVTGAVKHVNGAGLAEPASAIELVAWSFAVMVTGSGLARESLQGDALAEVLGTIEAFVAFGLIGLLGFVLGNRIRR